MVSRLRRRGCSGADMKPYPPSVVRRQREALLGLLRHRMWLKGGDGALAIESALKAIRSDPKMVDGALEVLGAMEKQMPSGSDYRWALDYFQDELGVAPGSE